MSVRWLFGDQLGPHFTDDLGDDAPVLLVESRRVFARRRFHRAKAHLVLSAMRHRAAELGDRCIYAQVGTYAEALDGVRAPKSVAHPTSHAALRFARGRGDVEVLPARGFATPMPDFARWADGRGARRLLLEDFYRDARRRLGVLMDGDEPAGGRWNFDADNREPPPRGGGLAVPGPWWPVEDDVAAQVREDLDRWERDGDVTFVGRDGPRRFAATRAEALAALDHFVTHRLDAFGPHEDAMLADDPWMAHSLLSAPMNLGLLDPLEVVARAEQAYRAGEASLQSVEGFVRQVIGWRDYVWHLYWHQPPDYRDRNALAAGEPLPQWFAELDADAVEARCLSTALAGVRDHGWVHHIPRLMVLGNWALQRGVDPAALTDWFHRCFVDGYDWVMVPNVVGMSQHADGGVMATKPYASGGAYVDRMSDFCRGCRYNPKKRLGPDACPYTAGYWAFLDRTRDRLAGNHRMAQPLKGLERLADLDAVVAQERDRGTRAP
ncbi:cryptochrome/photolyase family protein [Kineosporia sp. A_224]|uniref:cryptochrome/photolyase family protein n=1 Tax=Kineosporia sp. A_224 TaxID=1962180 RepID=UPI000B4B01B4|nr:cryptochrome/photolyase family protein [Kineosporia sp. A_224]